MREEREKKKKLRWNADPLSGRKRKSKKVCRLHLCFNCIDFVNASSLFPYSVQVSQHFFVVWSGSAKKKKKKYKSLLVSVKKFSKQCGAYNSNYKRKFAD